jgi:putative isomerase
MKNKMTLITRRDALAGLAASGAVSFLSASAEQNAAPTSNAAPLDAGTLSPAERSQNGEALLHYFAANAPKLLRPSAGVLKYPSIAPSLPGKEYSAQLWDWDTLWTSRGLFRVAALTHDESLKQKLSEHVSGSLLNFLDHASGDGRIPILMTPTDPDPFRVLGSNGISKNQAKPVFGQLGLLAAEHRGEVAWLAPHFDAMLRFYNSWTAHNMSSIGLLVWGDDVAIGDDNDPTTFGRPFFSSANLMLNCLYYEDLRASAELAKRLGRAKDRDRLSGEADTLAQNIQKYCWDPRDSYYYSADVQCVDRRAELIPSVPRGMDMSWKSLPMRIQMFTGFLPLWCGIATQAQAAELVRVNYAADDRLRARWGVRSLSSRESMYTLAFSSNPSNWLGPVWIVVNYFAWKGLARYGFHAEARELADKTITLLAADLKANGSLNEYYHPDSGAALSHKGFMDWNLLVLEML